MYYNYKNIKIHYEIIGVGKPILILHGLACSMEMMKGFLENIFKYNPNYSRIYIDLIGMGNSQADLELASSDIMLDMLTFFVNDIIKEKFLIIGESYGGYLSRGLLSKFSDKVDGLMLLCPVMEPIHSKRTVAEKNFILRDENFLKQINEKDLENFENLGVI